MVDVPMSPRKRPTYLQSVEFVDPSTGEQSSTLMVKPITKKHGGDQRESEHHLRLFISALPILAELKIGDWELLLILFSKMEWEAPFRYSTAELAERMQTSAQVVSRTISRLKRQRIVIEVGARNVVLINPDIAWQGNASKRTIWKHRIERGQHG